MSTRHRLLLAPLVLGLLSLMSACAATRGRTPLDGAWECVSPPPAARADRAVKILADGRFAFGCQASSGRAVYSGGGTYTFDGSTYTESITYHWVPELVGETIVFDCALKDGLWYHRMRVTEAGGPSFIDEIWRRIDEPGPAHE